MKEEIESVFSIIQDYKNEVGGVTDAFVLRQLRGLVAEAQQQVKNCDLSDVNNWVAVDTANPDDFLRIDGIEMPYECRYACHWDGEKYVSEETNEEVKITHWRFSAEPPCL